MSQILHVTRSHFVQLVAYLTSKFSAPLSIPAQDEISGDVFDLLLSLSDFGEFKELMLEHKR